MRKNIFSKKNLNLNNIYQNLVINLTIFIAILEISKKLLYNIFFIYNIQIDLKKI